MPEPERIAPTHPTSAAAEVVDESSDQESVRLMLRVKEGDVKAFERLVELHQNAIIGTCARMLNNVDDAHDIAQQVFIRVWRSAPRYEPTAKFTTWLYTITRNLVFNETRRRSRRKEVSIEQENEDDPPKHYADHSVPGADENLAKAEFHDALDRAIAALPEKQRMAVILRGRKDLPYEEICGILKMSLPALKSLLFRARNDLRKHLANFLGEDVE
ncbi:RNA polymerase sigma factor [Prosthecobacter sp.]|jgi:RNA polymerase sigma-70 factor (ECF subfamily)|uniref:RNA polymerase sigma factor n=1 Tax=Prosthecobacter sp. TaxID=1965333 RepID=UPI0037838578